MSHSDRAIRVGGAWLAVASFLMIAALGLHGPIPPGLEAKMAMVAGAGVKWSVVHWMAAAALSLYAVSGLIVLTSRSRLTGNGWSLTAWAVVCVGAFWTMTTAVVETTVMPGAAVAGSEETFAAWWSFAEGKGSGFAFLALAVALIAGSEARSAADTTPPWAAWIAVIAGIGSFAGWALGMWLGVRIGNLLWLAASLVMSLWTLWFGVTLFRTSDTPGESGARAATGARPARAHS